MGNKHFEFADFVEEFKVPFTVIWPGDRSTYDDNGKMVKGAGTPQDMTGIILPFGPDDYKKADNGKYTEMDRKVYVTEKLAKGCVVEKGGERYTIDRQLPYEDYADVFIYYAKGEGK